ncbi:hypothetical protein [Vulgatibacter sp.]|uniref:hypothetical protein n=1 Tax=Vulgatibacter sp. TaxID=1971226 RepID=UPI0035655A43
MEKRLLLLAAAALLLCGCDTQDGEDEGGGGGIGTGGAAGGSGGAGGGGGANPPERGATFELRRAASAGDAIYVQRSSEAGAPAWLELRAPDGTAVRFVEPCDLCPCDACGCGVCGAAMPVVDELAPGASISFDWDGAFFPRSTCPGSSVACVDESPATAGTWTARFCWSTTTDGVGNGHHVGALDCAEATFRVPAAGTTVAHIE